MAKNGKVKRNDGKLFCERVKAKDMVVRKDGKTFVKDSKAFIGKVERISGFGDKEVASISIFNWHFGFHNCGGFYVSELKRVEND